MQSEIVEVSAETVTMRTFTGAVQPAEVISDLLPPGDAGARFYPLPDVVLLGLSDPPEGHPWSRAASQVKIFEKL